MDGARLAPLDPRRDLRLQRVVSRAAPAHQRRGQGGPHDRRRLGDCATMRSRSSEFAMPDRGSRRAHARGGGYVTGGSASCLYCGSAPTAASTASGSTKSSSGRGGAPTWGGTIETRGVAPGGLSTCTGGGGGWAVKRPKKGRGGEGAEAGAEARPGRRRWDVAPASRASSTHVPPPMLSTRASARAAQWTSPAARARGARAPQPPPPSRDRFCRTSSRGCRRRAARCRSGHGRSGPFGRGRAGARAGTYDDTVWGEGKGERG